MLCERRVEESDPWSRHAEGSSLPLACAGFVESVDAKEKDGDGVVRFHFFISDEAHVRTDSSCPNWREWHERYRQRERDVLELFEGAKRQVVDAKGRSMHVFERPPEKGDDEEEEDGEIAPAAVDVDGAKREREKSVSGIGRKFTLSPAGKLHSAVQRFEALHHFAARLYGPMRAAMLSPPPDRMPKTRDVAPPPLALEVESQPELAGFLRKTFNAPQLAAIKWAAAHTLRNYDGDNALTATDVDAAAGRESAFPFTLVQGPPGTGKTHTVWGMLNIIHFVLYQRYYQSLHRKVELDAARASGDLRFARQLSEAISRNGGDAGDDDDDDDDTTVRELFDYLARETGVQLGANLGVRKPRVLVCAPSNAAIDNLLERVVKKGFIRGDGTAYRPNIIRVGADDAMGADAVSPLYAGERVETLIRMGPEKWDAAYRKQAAFVEAAGKDIEFLCAAHNKAARVARTGGVSGSLGGLVDEEVIPADPAEAAAAKDARDAAATARVVELCRLYEERNRGVMDMARFACLLSKLGKLGNQWKREAKNKGKMGRRLRNVLEASFVDEAEIVFTTLTSASRRVFQKLTHGFDTVFVDEAAQVRSMRAFRFISFFTRPSVSVSMLYPIASIPFD